MNHKNNNQISQLKNNINNKSYNRNIKMVANNKNINCEISELKNKLSTKYIMNNRNNSRPYRFNRNNNHKRSKVPSRINKHVLSFMDAPKYKTEKVPVFKSRKFPGKPYLEVSQNDKSTDYHKIVIPQDTENLNNFMTEIKIVLI